VLRYIGNFGEAVFNTSAISELKNSGSIRLIEDKKLVGEIADYYERIIFATRDYMPTKEQTDALQKTINDFFSLQYLDDYIQSYSRFTETDYLNKYNHQDILEHQPVLQLLNDSPKELKKLYTEISQFEIQLKKYNFWLYKTKGAAEKLITDIQKEYHLK
jgi:hypothetical protein